MRLLIGHGSGSFGHIAAAQHATQNGAATASEWLGFAEVWASAHRLNRIVIDFLMNEKLPVINFPPSASIICDNGKIQEMAYQPIMDALDAGLIPVVFGDVAFDRSQGAAIVSTESIFTFLSQHLQPTRVLIAGIESGVYANYPESKKILQSISANDLDTLNVKGAQAVDVTGGMRGKVEAALEIASRSPDAEVRIFSGENAGAIEKILLGAKSGTLIKTK
jgi:isopentenyl phosphate kinase